jgi:hypothetical protein
MKRGRETIIMFPKKWDEKQHIIGEMHGNSTALRSAAVAVAVAPVVAVAVAQFLAIAQTYIQYWLQRQLDISCTAKYMCMLMGSLHSHCRVGTAKGCSDVREFGLGTRPCS